MIEQQKLSQAVIERFLEEFGCHIGIDELVLDENNTAELIIDGEIELSLVFMPHLPGLVVGAPVPNVPTDRPEYLKTLMQANMSLPLTKGGIFVMLPGRDEAMLCWFVAIGDGDVARFDREIAAIVDFAKVWIAEIDAALTKERNFDKEKDSLPKDAIRV